MPEDWRFIGEGGTFQSGNLSFQTDTASLRLEWKPINKRNPDPLDVVTERFIKKIRKNIKKNVRIRKGFVNINEHKASFVNFNTDVKGQEYFWYCKPTNRLIIIEFMIREDENIPRSVIRKILRSFTCHGSDKRIWSVLGFRFETPKSLKLSARKFVVGRGMLSFLERKRSLLTNYQIKALFEYYSMANLQFEDLFMEHNKWFDNFYLNYLRKEYGKLRFGKPEAGQVQGHEVEIREGTLSYGLTWRSKAKFFVASWFCPNANRMYAITVAKEIIRPIFLKRQLNQEDLIDSFQKIVNSVQCH